MQSRRAEKAALHAFDGTSTAASTRPGDTDHYLPTVSPPSPSPLLSSLAGLSDPLSSYQTMSKAVCGSTSSLIDAHSPFLDKGTSVQLTANDMLATTLAGTNLHFLLEKVFNGPSVIKLISLSSYYCLELAGRGGEGRWELFLARQ